MLYYLSIAKLGDKKANVVQQMNMCQAFVANGVDLCFLHPGYKLIDNTTSWEEFAEFYNLTEEFDIKTVRTPNLRSRFVEVPIEAISLNKSILYALITNRLTSEDVVYSRAFYPCTALLIWLGNIPRRYRPTIVHELHTPVDSLFSGYLYRNVDLLVCASPESKEVAVEKHGVPSDRCSVVPNGVDLSQYKDKTREDAREELNLDTDEDIVMYTGHLYPRKGVHLLCEAAPEIDAQVYVVGGYQEDVERVRSDAPDVDNLHFTGFVEPDEISTYQVASDVLVAPYTSDIGEGSPIKIFEYMAAGSPIVASRHPIVQNILTDEENAFLFEPEDVQDLTEKINIALRNDDLARSIVENAAGSVEKYTWEGRAEKVLSIIESEADGNLSK